MSIKCSIWIMIWKNPLSDASGVFFPIPGLMTYICLIIPGIGKYTPKHKNHLGWFVDPFSYQVSCYIYFTYISDIKIKIWKIFYELLVIMKTKKPGSILKWYQKRELAVRIYLNLTQGLNEFDSMGCFSGWELPHSNSQIDIWKLFQCNCH